MSADPIPLLIQGDARRLPLADESVDLIVTSPPYWSLRSYSDGGEHYDGQIGSEPDWRDFLDVLIECTREWVRVLKPSGSMWVNLGDKFNAYNGNRGEGTIQRNAVRQTVRPGSGLDAPGIQAKSLLLLPHRYAIRCCDELGLICRMDQVWSKVNGLPESVTDRTRRSHEYLFHLVKQPRYYSAVDEIREPHTDTSTHAATRRSRSDARLDLVNGGQSSAANPLGKLPGSVWSIPSQPLNVPEHISHARCCDGQKRLDCEDGLDHYACVDTETEILTRRGWLRHHQLVIGDEVAGHDLDTGIASWTRCHGVHRYDFDGELVAIDTRVVSMRLTHNHRTLIHDHRGVHRLRGPLQVVDASAVTSQYSIPRSVEWAEDGREKSIGVDLAALCGWIAAEGWFQNNRRQVLLSQSVTANASKVEQIDRLLAALGDNPLRVDRHRTWLGNPRHEVQWRLGVNLAAEIFRLMPDKLLPAWFGDLPLGEARRLLDAFLDGDGHRRPDGRMWVGQKLRPNLDVLQAIAVRLGYNTTLRRDELNNRWGLNLSPPRPARLRQSDGTSLVRREYYRGVVWCPTTGTGTFVARRNGSVFVTGNSFPFALVRPIILGWSPREVCTICGEGRVPTHQSQRYRNGIPVSGAINANGNQRIAPTGRMHTERTERVPTGERCSCPDTSASATPGVVVDPFGGTGSAALVAAMNGRTGISVDASWDYGDLIARWRINDPKERARAAGLDPDAVARIPAGDPLQGSLMDLLSGAS